MNDEKYETILFEIYDTSLFTLENDYVFELAL